MVPVTRNVFNQLTKDYFRSMKKKDAKKKQLKPEEKASSQTEKAASDLEKDTSEEKPFDFGGLPQRDLKKNLGCG